MKRFAILSGFLLLALWPEWLWYARRMTDGSDEPYGLIALVAGFAMLWRSRDEIHYSAGPLWVSLALLAAQALARPFLPGLVSAVFALLILAVATGTLTKLPAVWAVFALSLPLVASMQFFLGYPLRLAAAVSAETILNLTPLEVRRGGTELFWEGNRVGVDPPCSGVEMLWAGLLIVALLCAWNRCSFLRTIGALGVGAAGVVVANCARVTILFVKESGIVSLPEWTHEGIGIAIFALFVWIVARLFGSSSPPSVEAAPTAPSPFARPLATMAACCLFLTFTPLILPPTAEAGISEAEFPGWPEKWEGRYLETLPLTESELVFAGRFPGKVGVFSTGPDKIILRWVTRPTRKLHSSADCLRASGYRIETERDGLFLAYGNGGTYVVEETIFNGEDTWANVSQWFWSATLGRSQGPWWAATRIRSADESWPRGGSDDKQAGQ